MKKFMTQYSDAVLLASALVLVVFLVWIFIWSISLTGSAVNESLTTSQKQSASSGLRIQEAEQLLRARGLLQ